MAHFVRYCYDFFMSKTFSVLGLILLGAIAAGAGAGYFLYAANQDRLALSEQIQLAEQRVKDLESQSTALADQAEDHIQSAQEELKKAQEQLTLLKQERELEKTAFTLKPSKSAASWKETLDLALGVSIKLPPNATEKITENALLSSVGDSFVNWLQIERYTPDRLSSLSPTQVSSTEYIAVVNDALLIGNRYTFEDKTVQYLLRLQKNASSTHVIFATTQNGITEKVLLDSLSTLKTP